MKHCILAKWKETVSDKAALLAQVTALYRAADSISGVHSVQIYLCGTSPMERAVWNAAGEESDFRLRIIKKHPAEEIPQGTFL